MAKVLLVCDDIELLKDRSQVLKELGYNFFIARDVSEALNIVHQNHPDVVIIDLSMPNFEEGLAVLKSTKEFDPNIPIIIFTASGSVELAVRAMKLGAYDFIPKPISPEMLQVMLKNAVEYEDTKKDNLILKTQIKESNKLKDVVCQSPRMLEIVERVIKVARTDINIFIYGETGAGKEMIARNIHLCSHRKCKPFIPLDCVALPPMLLESEIFGFEKGAFTGAIKSKPGMLEIADGGTLFLDEIADLEPGLQVKLLRVIEDHQFRRIGGTKMIKVNIRIISATNRNPEQALKEKRLREDFYFRLNVVPILVPPLRERKADISHLVKHFIAEFNPMCSNEIKGISEEAVECLQTYNWPGNVRELKNVIQQIMSLSENSILDLNDLPDHIRKNYKLQYNNSFQKMSLKEARKKCLNQFYRAYFNNLLKNLNGNLTKVAEKADISRKTLYRILNDNEIV